MILEDYLEIKANGATMKHYIDLGYNVEKNKPFTVKNEDLTDGSKVMEKIKCDCCSKEITRQHCAIIDTRKRYGMDLCKECSKIEWHKRIKETNNKLYGVDYPMQSKEIKNKSIKSTKEHYGEKGYFASEECKENTKKISLEKYGVDWPSKSEIVKEKIKKTNLGKYGFECASQSLEVKEKTKESNLRKYGYSSTAQIPEVRQKMKDSLYKNGNVPTSKQQLELFELCKEWFPNCLVELNYPVDLLNLDIRLTLPNNILIDLEYDGQYWHKNKKKDYARDIVVQKEGYKIIRVKSGSLLPTKEQLEEAINYVSQDNHTFSQIKLSDWKEENNK